MTHTRDYLNKQNVIKLSLLLLLLCNVKISYAEDITIRKSLKLGVNYSLLDGCEIKHADGKVGYALRLDKGERNLDLEISQLGDHKLSEGDELLCGIDFGEPIKESFTEKDLIEKDLNLIIERIAGGEENTKKPLKLVVNTEAIWAASDPTPRLRKESSETTPEAFKAYASQLEQTAVDENYYKYLVEYAKILKEKNIKWTLSIGHIPPDWIRKEFDQTGKNVGHSLPVSPNSQVWRAAKPWIEGLIKELKEFIGNGKTIEEIFIINEMMFSKNDSTFSEGDLELLYLKLRGYVIDSLENNGIRDVKVSWKLVGNFKAMPTHGLSDEIMKELLPQPDNIHNEGHELTNLIGINFYEGKGLKDGNACKGSIDGTLESDTYDVLTHYREDILFKGDIYFTEYGSSTIPFENNQQLTDCIQYSFDNGVTYWAFFKWNDIRNIKNYANNEIVIGLKNTFTRLLYAFPDVPISSNYSEAITELRKMGVLHGNPDGTFRPQDKLNRAEATKIIVKTAEAAGIQMQPTDEELSEIFSDTQSGEWCLDKDGKPWCNEYIGKLYHRGSIAGYPDGRFLPGKTVSRAEMLKMVILTFSEDEGIYSEKTCQEGVWFCQYVEKAEKDGIEPLHNGSKFVSINPNPHDLSDVVDKDGNEILATREETVKAVYDAYTIYKKNK